MTCEKALRKRSNICLYGLMKYILMGYFFRVLGLEAFLSFAMFLNLKLWIKT